MLLFPGCAMQYSRRSNQKAHQKIPIVITMPGNVLVHQNIAPFAYQALTDHFRRANYRLVKDDCQAYTLRSKITKLETPCKFISPDVVLYGYYLKVKMVCWLLNTAKKIVAKKVLRDLF
jgi:hypothetical protein